MKEKVLISSLVVEIGIVLVRGIGTTWGLGNEALIKRVYTISGYPHYFNPIPSINSHSAVHSYRETADCGGALMSIDILSHLAAAIITGIHAAVRLGLLVLRVGVHKDSGGSMEVSSFSRKVYLSLSPSLSHS